MSYQTPKTALEYAMQRALVRKLATVQTPASLRAKAFLTAAMSMVAKGETLAGYLALSHSLQPVTGQKLSCDGPNGLSWASTFEDAARKSRINRANR